MVLLASAAAAADLANWSVFGSDGTRKLAVVPQIPVTAMSSTAERANNSPNLVADPGDPTFLALVNRLDAPDYSCALHVSGDGGQTWSPVTPVPALPDGVEKCYGPEVAIDGKGRIHFAFLGLAGRGNLPKGAYFTTSADRGRTFSPSRLIIEGFNFAVRMAVDPESGPDGRIHIAWLRAGESPGLGSLGTSVNPILAIHSDDAGATFSEPVQVSEVDRRRVIAPSLALGPRGDVHVAYYDLGDDLRDYQGLDGPVWDGTWELVMASSDDGGSTFARSVVVDSEVVPYDRVRVVFTHPQPSVAAHDDRVCTAWTDARFGEADVLSRCSQDRGRTWETARRVNGDGAANGLWQYMPRIGIAPGGRVDVVFYDRSPDPQNRYNTVAYTRSTDGGRTFEPAIDLTPQGPSYSEIGQQYAVPSAGDSFDFGGRMALLSRRDHVVAAWTDTHNSAMPTVAQDIFATVVEVPDADGGGGFPLVAAGAVAVVLGLIGFWLVRSRRSKSDTGPTGSVDGGVEEVSSDEVDAPVS